MNDTSKLDTNGLIREMHSDIKVLLSKDEAKEKWLLYHEKQIKEHTKQITKIRTVITYTASILALAWTGLLAWIGWSR